MSAPGQSLDQFLRTQFDVLQYLRDNFDAIQRVADHLTPVEDLQDLKDEIDAIYPRLGLLVEASEIIIQATDAGLALLVAEDAAAQRAALELGSAALREEGYFATATALADALAQLNALSEYVDTVAAALLTKANQTDLDTLDARVTSIEGDFTAQLALLVSQLEGGAYLGTLQTSINDLQTQVNQHGDDISVQAARVDDLTASLSGLGGLVDTAVADANSALTVRVDEQDGNISALTSSVDTLSATVVTQGEDITAHGTAIGGLTTQVTAMEGTVETNSAAIEVIGGQITDLETGIEAEAIARDALTTRVTATENDIEANSMALTEVSASLTGVGNQLPNAGFETNLRDWSVHSIGVGWTAPYIERLVGPVAELPGAIAMVLRNDTSNVDPYYANVVSLLHFDGVNNATAATDQKGKVWTFIGNAKLSNVWSRFGATSLLLDGNGDYLEAASHVDFNIGTSHWSLNVSIKPTSVADLEMIVSRRETSGSTGTGWALFKTATGGVGFNAFAAGGTTVVVQLDSPAALIATNGEYDIEVVRKIVDGIGQWKLFLDGVIVATATESAAPGDNTNPLRIGYHNASGTNPTRAYTGWIDEVRITKGIARHDVNFARMTVPFPDTDMIATTADPSYATVTSLNHFNGLDGSNTCADQSSKVWTFNGNAKLSTTKAKFGVSSLYLDGSGDYISTPAAVDLRLDSDFTLEAFINPDDAGGVGVYMPLFGQMNSTASNNGRWMFSLNQGFITFNWQSVAGTAYVGAQVAYSAPAGVWTHVAVTRQGTTYRIFVNGVLLVTNVEANVLENLTGAVYIGTDRYSSALRYYKGYIDEARFSRTCRYTANFTPPVSPFPDTAVAAPAPTGDCGVRSKRFPVDPNSRQIVSTWLGGQNCTARAEWRVFNAAGAQIDQGLFATASLPLAYPATRYYDSVNVPATGAYMEIQLWATAATSVDARAVLLRPMVEEATAGQLVPSPWTPSVAGIEDAIVTAQTSLEAQIEVHDGVITTLQASYTLTLDVNGYIAGWKFVNDGSSGTFNIAADQFSVTAPAGYKSLQWSNGILSATDGAYTRYQGAGFGEGSAYVDWFGLTPGTGAAGAEESNAIFYIKKDGSAYFGGDVNSGEGSDLVVNGSFEFSPGTGYLNGTNLQVGARIAGAWEVLNVNNSGLWDVRLNSARVRSGSYSLQFANVGGNLTAGATAYVVVANNRWLKVLPGQKFMVLAAMYEGWSGSWLTGLNRRLFVGMRFYDKNKVLLADNGIMYNANGRTPTPGIDMTQLIKGLSTAPANAAYARVGIYAYFQNTTGATLTLTSNLTFLNVDDVYVYRWHGGHALTEPGSGEQIGDPRALNPIVPANVGSIWSSGTISYTASAGTPATATISVGASTLQMGDVVLNYNAMSVGVTGTNGATVKYYLYCDDPTWAAGARTLVATTSQATATTGNGRIYVGAISVTFPASGSGGGTPPRECVPEWSLVPDLSGDGVRKMGDIRKGADLLAINPVTGEEYPARVFSDVRRLAPCITVHTENGVEMPISLGARVRTSRGWVHGGDLVLGDDLLTKTPDGIAWSEITLIEDIGWHPVVNAVTEEQGKFEETGCYWTGAKPGFYGAHHNIKNGLG